IGGSTLTIDAPIYSANPAFMKFLEAPVSNIVEISQLLITTFTKNKAGLDLGIRDNKSSGLTSFPEDSLVLKNNIVGSTYLT
ncbi:hypothetical protein WAH74_19615, partial [Acinetobacter baumannii]